MDQKDGMEQQIETPSLMGTLSQFVGMLTDSRSFLSYTVTSTLEEYYVTS